MLSISTTLAIFAMLGLSSFAIFWAKRAQLPHTVFLVIIGVVLGFLAQYPGFAFFNEFQLTPELIFFLLLPTLIFESAYNISSRRLISDAVPILVLSIIGLLVSTIVISGVLYFALQLIGITVPFIVTLLFGALISATDPVAVLALFKEYGAPRRLSLIFEGESLFNDATAVALFLIILDIALFGFAGNLTILSGLSVFTQMIVGGVLFGAFMGALFARLVGLTRTSEVASITLTIVLAHLTFILAESISQTGVLHLSPIIATTIASIIMGNYGRAKIHPGAEEFVGKLWEQLAFMANSLIFILIGILFIEIPFSNPQVLLAIIIAIVVVAFARAVSIYPVISTLNLFVSKERRIPESWQHLLSWGSLRGALAVTMVLLIPETLTHPLWTLEGLTIREFLLALTVGCIFATLFIKAPTIQSFMRRLKLDALAPIENVEYEEAHALMHLEVAKGLQKFSARGYIEKATADDMIKTHKDALERACRKINALPKVQRDNLTSRILRMFAIGIEKRHLKILYQNHDITESVYRRIMGKLTLQYEAIEQGNLEPNMSIHTDSKDVFEKIAAYVHRRFGTETEVERTIDKYLYYRAQAIISRKVLKEINELDRKFAANIFTPESLQHVVELYTKFQERSSEKMLAFHEANRTVIEPLTRRLAEAAVRTIEREVLDDVFERELITNKLYINLREEIDHHEGGAK